MSKIKIRAATWDVYADSPEKYPPYLGSISRPAYQDRFIVYSGGRDSQPPKFATFTEAVDYLRANQAERAA